MSISNINAGSESAPVRRFQEVERVEGTRPPSGAPEQAASNVPQERPGDDHVEISEAGRASHAEHSGARAREVEYARTALRHAPGLDAERAAQIKERVEQGYYSQDDVIAQVAERMLDGTSAKG